MRIKGFLRLLKKYSEGSLTGEKKEVMDAWYDALKYNSEPAADRKGVKSRIWDGVLSKTAGSGDPEHDIPEAKFWWKSLIFKTAVCLVLLTGGVLLYQLPHEEEVVAWEPAVSGGTGWHFIDNTGSQNKDILLSDGSRVILEPGGKLKYPDQFSNDSRSVYTEGNVRFEVAKDSGRPFFAFAGEVVVRVLGTSFTVRNIAGKAGTEVAVISGKVMVERVPGTERRKRDMSEGKVVLTPNEKVTFFRNSQHYITGLVENPVMIEKTDEFTLPEAFDFDETPLSRILAKLERAYGVSIAVSDDSILDCQLTADLSSDNLYGKMELICAIMGAKYEITGNAILLSGGVCSILEK